MMNSFLTVCMCSLFVCFRGSLDAHLSSAHNIVVPHPHECLTCGQKFKEKLTFSHHMKAHATQNEKKFKCQFCPSGFSKGVNLRYHVKKKHPEATQNNNNNISSVTNNNPSRNLDNCVSSVVNNTASAQLSFPNSVYPAGVVQVKYEANNNIISSSGSRDKNQQQAGEKPVASGADKNSASLNMNTSGGGMLPPPPPGAGLGSSSAGEKPQGNFKCDQCGRTFLFKNNLKAHLRTHTRDKKYTCELCEKSFIYKESLKNHMLLHSNELPYDCSVCGKKFR